jgi:hypothetical protein
VEVIALLGSGTEMNFENRSESDLDYVVGADFENLCKKCLQIVDRDVGGSDISGSYGSEYEYGCVLGCCTV